MILFILANRKGGVCQLYFPSVPGKMNYQQKDLPGKDTVISNDQKYIPGWLHRLSCTRK